MGRIVRCLDTGEVKNPLYVALETRIRMTDKP